MRFSALLPVFCAFNLLTGCGGGGSSSGGSGGGQPQNPSPAITSISPDTALQSAAAFTLTVTGSGFISTSTVQWGGAALVTTYASATTLKAGVPASALASVGTAKVTVVNPAPGGGTSNSASFAIAVPPTRLVSMNLMASDIVWDAAHGKIYAAVPGTETNGNSIVAVDPVKQSAGSPQPAGTNPLPLAISADDSLLYAGLADGSIKRFSLPGLTPDASFTVTLPTDPTVGQQVAIGLAVAPGAPHTFAAILGNYNWTGPNTGGTLIYDDAVMRANGVASYQMDDSSLAWGSDAATLFANDGVSSGNNLFVMDVAGTGVTLKSNFGYLVPTEYGAIHFDSASGSIYADGGRVVDPNSADVVGTFDVRDIQNSRSPLCALDLTNGRVFFLGQTIDQGTNGTGMTVAVFDARTYIRLATISLPQVTGWPMTFLRWGKAGLAFTASATRSPIPQAPGNLYLLDGAFVSGSQPADFTTGGSEVALAPGFTGLSPEFVQAGSADLALTVTGDHFGADAAVTWNGTALQTTVVNSTSLAATIPAADLTTAGTAVINVEQGGAADAALNSLAFTVVPADVKLAAYNLNALDLAWDSSRSHLVLPVMGSDRRYANTVVQFDPATGTVASATPVPSDPDLVRITPDGSSLYLGFRTLNKVYEYSLPGLSLSSSWDLGYEPFFGPYYAGDLEIDPQNNQTTAVAFSINGGQPAQDHGFTLYDSGTARSNSASPRLRIDNVQWTPDGSTIYAASIDADILKFGVDASGLTQQKSKILYVGKVHLANGMLYDDTGQVINPSDFSVTGNLNASGLVVPDATLNRIFVLGQTAAQINTSDYTVQSFDMTTLAPVQSLTLPGLTGVPVAFTRWGSHGLAFVTYDQWVKPVPQPTGMLYVVNDA
ncbi:MAG TPA: IPT/TIG domain-containing protein, partial [Terracidiphilus sp.]